VTFLAAVIKRPRASAPFLLEGEDGDTPYLQDARHWIRIYEELVALNKTLVERASSNGSEPPQPALRKQDLRVIEDRRRSYQDRLSFWQSRHAELAGLDLDPQSRTLHHRGNTVRLTRREYELLSHISARPGRFISAALLAAEAWNDPNLTQEQVRTYVGRLRRTLADLSATAAIVTKSGEGYSLVFDGVPAMVEPDGDGHQPDGATLQADGDGVSPGKAPADRSPKGGAPTRLI
jgi:DNA-binding winged helix-turn-helix (wHTH) protein